MSKQITQDKFIKTILPDMDMIVVFERSPDPHREPPSRIEKDMARLLSEYFFSETIWHYDKLAEAFRTLYFTQQVSDSTQDPTEQFIASGKVRLDIIPCDRLTWRAIPAFIEPTDTLYFEWLPDVIFTCEPIGGQSDNIPLLLRRNILLRALSQPMNKDKIVDYLFSGEDRRQHLHMLSETRLRAGSRMWDAIELAERQGLVKEEKGPDGKLSFSRTALGDAFLNQVLNVRLQLLNDGIPKAEYDDRMLMIAARGSATHSPKNAFRSDIVDRQI